MAKSVLELAVSTGQWDAGLKKATSALNNFTQNQGGLQSALANDTDKLQKFIQMMGKTESTAKTAKGQMNDYKSTIEALTMQYNRMTDAQKNTIGNDYLTAIDAMKQKYQGVRNEVEAINKSLNNIKVPELGNISSSGSGLSGLSGALSVFGGNLMTKGFEVAAGAVTSFTNEIGDAIKQGIQLAKQGEGIRIAFERLGQGDILDGLRQATHGTVTDLELMKAAVKFNDFKLPVEELGTMLAFAQQKAKDTGQSVDYMVDSIVTGLGRKSLMILDNLGLSATQIRERMKETGDMTKAVASIIREEMAKAGDYVETAADRAAQANVSLQNKMEELGRKFAPLEEASNQFWTSMKIGILDVVGGPLARLLNGLTEAGRIMNAYQDAGGSTKVGNQLKRLREYSGDKNALYKQQVEAYKKYITPREEAIQIHSQRVSAGWNADEELKRRDDANLKKYGIKDYNDLVDFKTALEAVKQQLNEYVEGAKEILNPKKSPAGKDPVSPTPTPTPTPTATAAKGFPMLSNEEMAQAVQIAFPQGTTESMKELSQELARFNQLKQTATTTEEYNTAIQGIEDVKARMAVQPEALSMGVSTDVMQEMLDAEKDAMKEMTEKTLGGFSTEGIKLNPEGDKDSKKAWENLQKTMTSLSGVMSGVSTIGSGLQAMGIKLDEDVLNTIKGIQGAISVVQGVISIINAMSLPSETANTIATNANTVALGALTTAISTNSILHAVPGLAHGGIVPRAAGGYLIPGNSYSGDNIFAGGAWVNSGELVLSKAQQGNLAAQLEGGGVMQNLHLETKISAEDIRFILSAASSRQNNTEYLNFDFV
jgi:hypothetical protein